MVGYPSGVDDVGGSFFDVLHHKPGHIGSAVNIAILVSNRVGHDSILWQSLAQTVNELLDDGARR